MLFWHLNSYILRTLYLSTLTFLVEYCFDSAFPVLILIQQTFEVFVCPRCCNAIQIEFIAYDFKSGNMPPPATRVCGFTEIKYLSKSIICNRIKLLKKNLINSMLYLVNHDDVTGLPGRIHIVRECEQQSKNR